METTTPPNEVTPAQEQGRIAKNASERVADAAHLRPPEDRCGVQIHQVEIAESSFWDAEHGLVSTSDGQDGAIYRVSGAGESIERVACGYVGQLDTAGTSDAWIKRSVSHLGKRNRASEFLHSDDGGLTWDRLSRPPVYTFSFATPKVGMGMDQVPAFDDAEDSRAFVTHDGGKSWTRIENPCTGEFDLPGGGKDGLAAGFLSMVSESEAYAACSGYCCAHPVYEKIFRTSDGGATWQEVPAEVVGDEDDGIVSTPGYIIDADFSASGEGSMVESRDGYLYKTTALSPSALFEVLPGRSIPGGSASRVQELATGETIVTTRSPEAVSISDDGVTWNLMFEWNSG